MRKHGVSHDKFLNVNRGGLFALDKNTEGKITGWKRFCSLVYRNRFPLSAFALTYFALVVAAIIRGIAPFGDNSLLTMDLWGQYYPMIVEKLDNPFAIWSWNGSLGFSAIVQSAYYTLSLIHI